MPIAILGGRPPRGLGGPAEGPPPPPTWGPGKEGGEAPKDCTKPQQTIQSPKGTYKAPERFYKGPKRLHKDITYQTKPTNVRQRLEIIINKSSNT